MLPPELKDRVLRAVDAEPSPPRPWRRRWTLLAVLAALAGALAIFVVSGGPRMGGRPMPLVIGSAAGAMVIAALALYAALGRGRSMLGRPRVWLYAVVMLVPVLLFGWKLIF